MADRKNLVPERLVRWARAGARCRT